jgi:23S rRNA (cytosine1962-C5)-methyltransferase
MLPDSGYELIDFGDGARLERFGDRVVDRPHGAALGPRGAVDPWRSADLRFDRDRGWSARGAADPAATWSFRYEALSLELRPTEAGQVGLFPEHLVMLPWLRARVGDRAGRDPAPGVLNLFAYTGLATLAMAAAGARVTHVDASRPAVGWARHNAELSGLADLPIRWIVDDAVGFTQREARRERRYAGIVLDPPSYGHGPAARPWRLEDDLPRLLDACAQVLEPGGFVLLTAHTPGMDGDRLGDLLAAALRRPAARIETGELALAGRDSRSLDLGAFARVPRGAS